MNECHTLPHLESFVSFKRTNFLTLKAARSQVRGMALDIKTVDVTACYLVRTITHLMGLVYEYGAVID
jgi:hypothetical protein